MSKFKLEKKEGSLNIEWHYRGFIIENKVSYLNTYPVWVVKLSNGKEIYSNGNGTRKEMMEWVDDYYQEALSFVIDYDSNPANP